mgnify:CR=1 FL=1
MEYKVVTVSAVWSFAARVEKLTKAINEQISPGGEPPGAPASSEPPLLQALIERR